MLHLNYCKLKTSAKAISLTVYLLVNMAAVVAVSQDWAVSDTIQDHLCVGNLPLMTNVTPDIRC